MRRTGLVSITIGTPLPRSCELFARCSLARANAFPVLLRCWAAGKPVVEFPGAGKVEDEDERRFLGRSRISPKICEGMFGNWNVTEETKVCAKQDRRYSKLLSNSVILPTGYPSP